MIKWLRMSFTSDKPSITHPPGPHCTCRGMFVQVEIYVEVDEVESVGASAGTRATISATATTDAASAMNTLVSCTLTFAYIR